MVLQISDMLWPGRAPDLLPVLWRTAELHSRCKAQETDFGSIERKNNGQKSLQVKWLS